MPSNMVNTCIPCRFSAKQTDICPYCHGPMRSMGKAFKPPKKSNHSQWRKVELMVAHDIRFGYCSCHRNLRKIKTLADAKNLCARRKSASKNYAKIEDVRASQITRRKLWKGRLYG